jgi:hypothetical protein
MRLSEKIEMAVGKITSGQPYWLKFPEIIEIAI